MAQTLGIIAIVATSSGETTSELTPGWVRSTGTHRSTSSLRAVGLSPRYKQGLWNSAVTAG
jgi:hypothetical protein